MHTIGLMSGTSLDGVDAVWARFPGDGGRPLEVLAHVHRPFAEGLRQELLALNRPGDGELHRAAVASNGVALAYAEAVSALLQASGHRASDVRAIGAHGQTVRHQPDAGRPEDRYTIQLLNGALLAERTGIDVVCDFRARDLAAGGQGAPLVPAFHAAMFDRAGMAQAVLNIGGIANLTLLDGAGGVGGFDCGPGNMLMDLWCDRHLGRPYDADGVWAASGRVDDGLLARLESEPFFGKSPPKSTGRDLFDAGWLQRALGDAAALPQDVQATLAELTARAAARELGRHLPTARRLLVCGGGALNGHLMHRLASLLPALHVETTAPAGLPPMQVEAAAFAWLARAFLDGEAGNRPEVTGARDRRILGALHRGAPPG